MMNGTQTVWLVAGMRTPFLNVDGPFAGRDSLGLSVPVVQAMARQVTGPIDFGIWSSVVVDLAYANLAREVWLEAKLDPHVPTFTTIMQCSTSMAGVFEAAGILGERRAALAIVGGVESMTRVQIGLGQNFSVWLRRVFQARSAADRLAVLRRPPGSAGEAGAAATGTGRKLRGCAAFAMRRRRPCWRRSAPGNRMESRYCSGPGPVDISARGLSGNRLPARAAKRRLGQPARLSQLQRI